MSIYFNSPYQRQPYMRPQGGLQNASGASGALGASGASGAGNITPAGSQCNGEDAIKHLESEIRDATNTLKSKIQHFEKLLIQLGEKTRPEFGTSDGNSMAYFPGNPRLMGYVNLLNGPMKLLPQNPTPDKMQQFVHDLENRLEKLKSALSEIDNDIRIATEELRQRPYVGANSKAKKPDDIMPKPGPGVLSGSDDFNVGHKGPKRYNL